MRNKGNYGIGLKSQRKNASIILFGFKILNTIVFIFIAINIFNKRTLFNYIQVEKQFTFCNMKHDMKHQNPLL